MTTSELVTDIAAVVAAVVALGTAIVALLRAGKAAEVARRSRQ